MSDRGRPSGVGGRGGRRAEWCLPRRRARRAGPRPAPGPRPPAPLRIIGIGSPFGDDRVGLEAARRLAAAVPAAEVCAVDRRGADLLELLDGARSLILIDAARSGAPAGTIHELTLATLPRRPPAVLSSHGVDVLGALSLAAALGRPLPTGRVLAIEAGDGDGRGAALSPAVAAALDEVIARVRAACAAPPERRALDVSGTVQGVGFRPFVWHLATALGLTGEVHNTPAGVHVEIAGAPAALDAFERRLPAELPAEARIDAIRRVPAAHPPADAAAGFVIRASAAGAAHTELPPDLATCPACLAEILDPAARRFRYPFTNCTHCGPRLTVVDGLPYDRAATTLRGFPLCADCAREYADPADRRFHAEPIACPACGPHVWLEGAVAGAAGEGDAIAGSAALLRDGAVLAVLGLGGAHLACDATDAGAVARLRAIKQRPHKPLAVMVAGLAEAEQLASLDAGQRALLTGADAPITLVTPRPGAGLAAGIAPGLDVVGLMLAYTPLHHLLTRDAGRPLVMTSANRPGEPIAASIVDVRAQFGATADALLLHDRPIAQRCDDSVWLASGAGPQPLRRARGSVPRRLRVPVAARRPVLGVGGDVKNAFCLLDGDGAVLAPHIGTLEHVATQAHFRATLRHLSALTGIIPAVAACDLHPGYASRALAERLGLPLVGVQHHHAHLAACLAEHGRRGPAIGVAFDGTGYGTDGAIWGGELLIADLCRFERLGHLEYLPLPGGDAAIRHPLRVAAAYTLALRGAVDARTAAALGAREVALLERLVARGLHTVPTSSAGRLFDAAAALLGCGDLSTYEGEPAMRLEALCAVGDAAAYPFTLDADGTVRLAPLFDALLAERDGGVAVPVIAARFHATLVAIVVALAGYARVRTGLTTVALSGGCFQNRHLLDGSRAALAAAGFTVLTHRAVPANDGGLALGQAVLAAAREEAA